MPSNATSVRTSSFGTRHTDSRPVILEFLGSATGSFYLYHCLCFQNKFEHFSLEEMRLADYETSMVFAIVATSVPARKRLSLETAPSIMASIDSAHHEHSLISSADYSFTQSREDGV
jgi:hypothetical protein